MDNLFAFAAHNTAAALVFALFVSALTRVWRNPPVVHVLWLLVLLRLVAPPVLSVGRSAPRLLGSTQARGHKTAEVTRIVGPKSESHVDLIVRPAPARGSDPWIEEHRVATLVRLFWNRDRSILLGFWLTGSVLCALVAAARIARFEHLLRGTLPASERLQRVVTETAATLGVRRVPEVRYAECVEVPLLWCAGRRATIVLPLRLLPQLDEQQAALILAHELAHLRRRDHWVRVFELIVSTVYWWNPLVWLVRRRIHQAEDLCCDAWVRSAFAGCARPYAELLLRTAESLNASRARARLLPASPFLHSLSLKARIEMVLESRFAPSISGRSKGIIALLALLVLPWFVQTKDTAARAGSSDDKAAAPAHKPDGASSSEFPCAVKFEQGATRFLDGDNITIVEVRGTADTFAPGNIYWIKGTYTLASHDRAMLAAFTTARDAEHGKSSYLKVQTAVVNRGGGTFTLFLPMAYSGWPHVSFYPADSGEGFGGNYFGTGDSVLKKWWD